MNRLYVLIVTLMFILCISNQTEGQNPNHRVSTKFENRCGWIENPTPGNWWLVDKDGEWTISDGI